ncbi:unnamed protein product, partial [Mesorhabditis belari]|uniref:G-protein coupled receptors family 1 profile domain-containing protein n=1 Tax=Mesorhabditis belari TaxID=2138241 RepID=A0AAF3F4H8_9BILA
MTESCALGSVKFKAAWVADVTQAVHSVYVNFHPYIAVVLCMTGTLMNISTVLVLTRPSMISAVNLLLCAVAICDVIVMSSLSIFVSHFLLTAQNRCDPSDWSKSWAYFLYFHSQITVILHATSIWLTVILAQIRVLTIRKARVGPTEAIGVKGTMAISIITLLVCTTINMPNMLTFEIVEIEAEHYLQCLSEDYGEELLTLSSNLTQTLVYPIRPSQDDCGLLKIAYWTNGILFKVVPCILLTLSIVALLKIIADVANRRKNLAQVMNKKKMPRDHTTPMLVAVLSIFLIAELPQGILHVSNAIFDTESFNAPVYTPLGDLMDLLSLINSAVNFIIYCAMSRKFRSVFLNLFLGCLPAKIASKWQDDWGGDGDTSRPRPSGYTGTEQLALTSSTHRPSASSLLLRYGSRENLPKMYTGNLLTTDERVNGRSSPLLSVPNNKTHRISFDSSADEDEQRKNTEITEINLPVPSIHQKAQPATIKLRFNPFEKLRRFFESESSFDSPKRRANILQFETSSVY